MTKTQIITIVLTVDTDASDEAIAEAIASSLENMVHDGTAIGLVGPNEDEISIASWSVPSDWLALPDQHGEGA